MRRWIYLLIVTLICGCSFVLSEDQNLKTVGIRKEDANNLTKTIENQRPDKPREIRILQKEQEMQGEAEILEESPRFK